MNEVASATRPYSNLIAVYALLIAVALCYAWALDGPFVFDDQAAVLDRVERLDFDFRQTKGMRFVGDWTLIANYRLSGIDPKSFRLTNVVIHCLSTAALLALVYTTLHAPTVNTHFRGREFGLAFAIAALWGLHPLQTQAVTYVTQRYESLMGFFYLTTLLCYAKFFLSKRKWLWAVLGVVMFVLGLFTKQVMLTAPAVTFLYHRAFLVDSWKTTAKHWAAVFGLGLLLVPVVAPRLFRNLTQSNSAGFGWDGVTPMEYLTSQPMVLLHYLRLVVFPRGQCFDYGWQVSQSPAEVLIPSLIVGAAVLATLYAVWKNPRIAFLPMSFFLILSPSSSIVPINDLAVEHRMYLPSACVIAAVVFAVDAAATRLLAGRLNAGADRVARLSVLVCLGLVLGAATASRNQVYQSDVTLWQDVVEKRPHHARGWSNYGNALARTGDLDSAISAFDKALRIDPEFHVAEANLATFLNELPENDPRHSRAPRHALHAYSMAPDSPHTVRVLAKVLMRSGQMEGAMPYLEKALELEPGKAGHHLNYAIALSYQGEHERAIGRLKEAQRRSVSEETSMKAERALKKEATLLAAAKGEVGGLVDQLSLLNRVLSSWEPRASLAVLDKLADMLPDDPKVRYYQASVLVELGELREARKVATEALKGAPESARLLVVLGRVAAAEGDHEGAVVFFRRSLQADLSDETLVDYAKSLVALERRDDARLLYQKALDINPANSTAHNHLGNLLQGINQVVAEQHYRLALTYNPNNADANYNYGNLLARLGRFVEAERCYKVALQLKPDFRAARHNLDIVQEKK